MKANRSTFPPPPKGIQGLGSEQSGWIQTRNPLSGWCHHRWNRICGQSHRRWVPRRILNGFSIHHRLQNSALWHLRWINCENKVYLHIIVWINKSLLSPVWLRLYTLHLLIYIVVLFTATCFINVLITVEPSQLWHWHWCVCYCILRACCHTGELNQSGSSRTADWDAQQLCSL